MIILYIVAFSELLSLALFFCIYSLRFLIKIVRHFVLLISKLKRKSFPIHRWQRFTMPSLERVSRVGDFYNPLVYFGNIVSYAVHYTNIYIYKTV